MHRPIAVALVVLLPTACGEIEGKCFDDRTCGIGNRCEILEPGAPGTCVPCDSAEIPYDGIDNDCDTTTRDRDLDGDGENPPEAGGADCNDADPMISSKLAEICGDGKDNDCDSRVDEPDCADRESPALVFVSPIEGARIFGRFDVVAMLFDDVGLVRAQLFVDNIPVAASRDFTTPAMSQTVTFTVDSVAEGIADGTRVLRIELEDVAGNAGQSTRTVVFDNRTPPRIERIAPHWYGVYGGLMSIEAEVTDAIGVAEVSFSLNGIRVGTSTLAPHVAVVDTALFPDGTATVSIGALDLLGNASFEEVVVLIDNTPPALTFVEPADGSTISEVTTVRIVASDATGVAQIWSNGLTETSTSVLAYDFDPALVPPGAHTITASAADLAIVDGGLRANVTTASVTILVQ